MRLEGSRNPQLSILRDAAPRLLRMRTYSAACNPGMARAGFGAPTRSRRSDSDSIPPNAINTGPNQIRSTIGL